MNTKSSIILLVALLLLGCSNSIKKDSRVERTFKFKSFIFVEYRGQHASGRKHIKGEIQIGKETITIKLMGSAPNIDSYQINDVTYKNSTDELLYSIDNGDVYVDLQNNNIKRVTYITNTTTTTYENLDLYPL
jgi:hypothetical protein